MSAILWYREKRSRPRIVSLSYTSFCTYKSPKRFPSFHLVHTEEDRSDGVRAQGIKRAPVLSRVAAFGPVCELEPRRVWRGCEGAPP